MSSTLQDQSLALAGVAQFALYAHQLASAGRDTPARTDAARRAIFCTDPDTVADVYGGIDGVNDGIDFLKSQLHGRNTDAQAALVARYIGQLLRLAGRLHHKKAVQNQLRGVIDRAQLAEPRDIDSILADGYKTVISPLKPQIMLRGHPSYLENPILQARARTFLMAAVRCGFMWRQCGGNFFTLLVRRKALLSTLQHLPAANP